MESRIKKCEQIARDFIHTIHISECLFKCLCANGEADNLDQNLGLSPGPGFFSEAKLPTAAAILVGRGASHRHRRATAMCALAQPLRCRSPVGESALHQAAVPHFSPVTPSAIIRALVLRTQSPPSLNTRAGRYTSERSQGSRGFSTFPTENFLPAVAICAQPQHSEERKKKKKKEKPSFQTALAVVVKVLLGPPRILSHPVRFPFLFISRSCKTLGRTFPAALSFLLYVLQGLKNEGFHQPHTNGHDAGLGSEWPLAKKQTAMVSLVGLMDANCGEGGRKDVPGCFLGAPGQPVCLISVCSFQSCL